MRKDRSGVPVECCCCAKFPNKKAMIWLKHDSTCLIARAKKAEVCRINLKKAEEFKKEHPEEFARRRRIRNRDVFSEIHSRDMLLNNEAEFRGHGKRLLKEEWKTILETLIKNQKPGVWLLGKYYRQGMWAYDTCTTWKYVTHPITLPYLMES